MLLLLVVFGTGVSGILGTAFGEDGHGRCLRWAREFARNQHAETSPSEPKLGGTWVSQGCEVRPGPEFLLRKYHFYEDGSFHLQQFFYLDNSCTVPAYALDAWGKLQLSRPSWVVPGGTEAEAELSRVHVVPYTADVADRIAQRVNRSCPGQVMRAWRAYRKYRVLSYTENKTANNIVLEDIVCTGGLHVTVNELQLIRIVHQGPKLFRHQSEATTAELFLGDIHTDHRKKLSYRPTSYQSSLLDANAPGCHVCHLVSKAGDQSPPQLPPKPQLPVYLSGQWLSMRCEVRPLGLFLTRTLWYHASNSSWRGWYQYYRDPNCMQPWFLLRVEGIFSRAGPSLRLRGATNYDFQLLTAEVTPQDRGIVNNLNSASEDGRCGGPWFLNRPQDVTLAGGCYLLGLSVPSTKYEVVKMEVDMYGNALLFLGDVDTDGGVTLPERRATAYQTPLIQCRVFPELVTDNEVYSLPRAQLVSMADAGAPRCKPWKAPLVTLLPLMLVRATRAY